LDQLRELIKSDPSVGAFSEDIEQLSQLLSWDLNYSQLEGNFGLDTTHNSPNITVPGCEVGWWFCNVAISFQIRTRESFDDSVIKLLLNLIFLNATELINPLLQTVLAPILP
jgi:hypothetical protein